MSLDFGMRPRWSKLEGPQELLSVQSTRRNGFIIRTTYLVNKKKLPMAKKDLKGYLW